MSRDLRGKTCLILGASGFIGRSLTSRLAEEGVKLRVYGRHVEDLIGDHIDKRFEGDFGEIALLKSALEDVDLVFHLINTTSPASAEANRAFDITTNLVRTIDLLTLCLASNVKRVVFASSGGTVYGSAAEFPITESSLPNPISSYGITKLALEKYLHLFNLAHGMNNVILRISNPYGPFQFGKRGQGVIGSFMRAAQSGKEVTVWGNSIRDYIYVDDLSDAFVMAAKYDGREDIFNIGTGIGRKLTEVIQDIEDIVGVNLKKKFLLPRPFDVSTSVLDVRRAERELGWIARSDWKRSLAKTWEWVKDN